MRVVPIEAVTPGMQVAVPFYNQHGDILLRSGATLTDAYIDLLRQRGARALWIDEPDTADINPADALSERTRIGATSKVAGILTGAQRALATAGQADAAVLRSYVQSTEFLRSMAALPYWDMSETVDSIIDEATSEDPASTLLSSLKTADTYQFAHAVDSTVAAVILGARLKLDRGSLRRIARGSLLHDVGMMLIDQRIIAKPGKLDALERAQVEQHTALGYELLSAVNRDDVLANHLAFQHHERQDGTGYPRRLRGDNTVARESLNRGTDRILLVAEIAAVTDAYDALTADRPHRAALPPDVAWLLIQRMGGAWLNATVVREFLRFVPPFPLATEVVVLEGPVRGHVGVVCKVDPKQLDRPVIRLLANHRGERIKPFEVDLRRAIGVTIRAFAPTSPAGRDDAASPTAAAPGK